jgi:hypothetical protein
MECEVEKNEHFRHLLLYESSRGSKAAEATRTFVPSTEKTIAERAAQKMRVGLVREYFWAEYLVSGSLVK